MADNDQAAEEPKLEDVYTNVDGRSRFKQYPVGTPDPTKYHDASEAHMIGSNGAPLSSFLPDGRGVLLPRHRVEGGSLGFDLSTKPKVFVDPELTGNQVSVDFSKVSPADVLKATTRAHAERAEEPIENRGAAAYFALAMLSRSKQGQSPVGPVQTTSFREQEPAAAPQPDQMRLTADNLPAGLELPPVQPAATTPVQQPQISRTPVSILADLRAPVRREPMSPAIASTQPAVAPQKLIKVLFELPAPAGVLHTYYHDVVRTHELLILVYDHNQATQHVWFPSSPACDEDGRLPPPVQLGVLVYDADGHEDTGFIAYATGGRFTYQGVEFCLLSIEKEKSYKTEATNGQGPNPPLRRAI